MNECMLRNHQTAWRSRPASATTATTHHSPNNNDQLLRSGSGNTNTHTLDEKDMHARGALTD